MFIPITTASYDGIPPDKTDQASALINAARNTGGSIGISLVTNVLWHREQFHQSRLVDQAIPSSVQYQDTLHQMTNYFVAQGSSLIAGAAAGHRLDRTAGAGAGVVPRLYGRVLGADADLARGGAARAEPAQGQARGAARRWAIDERTTRTRHATGERTGERNLSLRTRISRCPAKYSAVIELATVRTVTAIFAGVRAAAKAVFSQGGAEASLEAVARHAGVGIGMLYRHFPTREAPY